MDNNENFHPVEPEQLYSELSYEEQINLTQNVKHKILHTLLTPVGTGTIPTDKESVETMLKVMDSMDRTTINNRKNQIDSEQGLTTKELLNNMAIIIREAQNKNPFAVDPTTSELKGQVPIVTKEELPEFEHAKGEDEIGIIGETSDEFITRMELETNKDDE